jgi:hypothetical protein
VWSGKNAHVMRCDECSQESVEGRGSSVIENHMSRCVVDGPWHEC